MRDEDKRAARGAYKERKIFAGIFAVRCAPSGQVWVGRIPNLGSVQNRLWFVLRFGSEDLSGLLAAWNAYGADNITFEELERLEDEETPYIRDAILKERLAHWRDKLGAAQIWR